MRDQHAHGFEHRRQVVLEHGRVGLPLESQLAESLTDVHQELLAAGTLDVGRTVEADLASTNPDEELLIFVCHLFRNRRRTGGSECAPCSSEIGPAAVMTFGGDFGP